MNKLLKVLRYFPLVTAGVDTLQTVAASVPGSDRKQILLNALHVGAQIGESFPNADVQLISALVDNVVGSLNAAGVFSKGSAPAAVPVAPAAA